MRLTALGVIAITSTMTFTCTTTTTTTTESRGAEPAPADSPASEEWRAKLARSKSDTSAILGKKRAGGTAGNIPWSGKSACGLATGEPTCDACLDKSCCTQNQACVNDADCSALITCGNACTDETCFANCFSTHPTG